MAIVGKGGSVLIDPSTRIAELSNWNLDLGADDVEITSYDSDGWKEYLAGLKEWTGSIEGNFEPSDTNGQRVLIDKWLSGEPIDLIFKVNAGISFGGSAFIKPSIETPIDDKVAFSADIQGTGALTVA